jgi:hypothetical protein
VIMVNMVGKRFYDETAAGFSGNQYGQIRPYVPHSYVNARNVQPGQFHQRRASRHPW